MTGVVTTINSSTVPRPRTAHTYHVNAADSPTRPPNQTAGQTG
jgi:hypothetical protein